MARTFAAFGVAVAMLGCTTTGPAAGIGAVDPGVADVPGDLPATGDAIDTDATARDALSPGQVAGAVWISEPRPAFFDFAVAHHLTLTAIFHWSGERTAAIETWLAFFKEAERRGIPLRISPLPETPDKPGGSYLAARDAQRDLDRVWDFVTTYQAEGLQPATIVLDIEGRDPGNLSGSLIRFAMLESAADRDALIAEALPPRAHAEAVAAYQAFVDRGHEAGWKVAATSMPMLANDGCDGANIQRALGTPITGVQWDFLTLQAYRTLTYPEFRDLELPFPTGYYVYRIAKVLHDTWGARGGVDLGLTSVNLIQGSEDDYQSFAEWGEDLAAARAAGIASDLVVPFRLELMFDSKEPADPAAWFADIPEPSAPPDKDQVTDLLLQIWCLADTRLGPLLPADPPAGP